MSDLYLKSKKKDFLPFKNKSKKMRLKNKKIRSKKHAKRHSNSKQHAFPYSKRRNQKSQRRKQYIHTKISNYIRQLNRNNRYRNQIRNSKNRKNRTIKLRKYNHRRVYRKRTGRKTKRRH